jgi:hypothetical protein
MEQFQANSLQDPTGKFNRITAFNETPLHKRPANEKYEVLNETFEFYQQFLLQKNFTEYQSTSQAYQKLPNEKMIVRREDPRKIFTLYQNKDGYTIGFEKERYANCVEWNPRTDGSRNIYNAFMEGFTSLNGLVTVIGFQPDANNDIVTMKDSIKNFYGLDRSGVRSYQGTVSLDTLKFITIRVPGHLLDEKYLTDEEINRVDEYIDAIANNQNPEPVMIFRTYLPPND